MNDIWKVASVFASGFIIGHALASIETHKYKKEWTDAKVQNVKLEMENAARALTSDQAWQIVAAQGKKLKEYEGFE